MASDELHLNTVWANDIDSNACKVYRHAFGSQELVEGDIRVHANNVPCHNLLTGGFPCQPFSSAGSKKGIKDPRGTLFKSIADILGNKKPEYFVLENVKRLLSMQSGVHFATILSEISKLEYYIEWRLVRACDLGLPQHRERLFIIGTRSDLCSHPCSKMLPIDDYYTIADKTYFIVNDFSKWKSIENHEKKFQFWGLAHHGKYIDATPSVFSEKVPCPDFKSFLEENVSGDFDFTDSTIERIKNSDHVDKLYNGVRILYNQGGGARMGYTVFGIDGFAPTLTATPSRHYERYKVNGCYRRLTNVEYARLQGFPDNHCSPVSVYNQYSLFGNAVPPQMAKWAIKKVLSDHVLSFAPPKNMQLSLI